MLKFTASVPNLSEVLTWQPYREWYLILWKHLKGADQTSRFPFFHLGYKNTGLSITAMREKIYLMLVPNGMAFRKVYI